MDPLPLRQAKNGLTRALARQRAVERHAAVTSGLMGYDATKSFAAHEAASVAVRDAVRRLQAMGVDPKGVDSTLHHERFPMWPGWAEKMLNLV